MIPPTKAERMDAESAAIKLLQDAGRARRAKARRPRRELCPVCGERVTDTGRVTENGRPIFSCGDAGFRSRAEAVRAFPRLIEPADFVGRMDRGELILTSTGNENVYGTDAQGRTYYTKDPALIQTLRKFAAEFPDPRKDRTQEPA